ncbi:MAG: rhamnulokinase family protein, partial [Oscillospiraceae bacterium]
MAKNVLAFDFGASSGRATLVSLEDGKINLNEIHRFSNDPIEIDGALCWDIENLFKEVKVGIKKAVSAGGFDSIGIDTWGVDFGLIDKNGDLITNPVHYRDTRTEKISEEVFKKIPQDEIYKRAGIQFMRFNTLYQLAYLCENKPQLIEKTDKIVMMADLFAYFLTNKMFIEKSNASTTNFLNPHTGEWDKELCDIVGIPTRILPQIIKAGQAYGTVTKALALELGCGEVPVVAVATHDTASAIVAVPALEKDVVYISCGTWNLFGTELESPIINKTTVNADFTNESGYNSITFLKNIIGLWLIQESKREWKRQGKDFSFAQLEQAAIEAINNLKQNPFESFINPDHPSFELPGDMPQ